MLVTDKGDGVSDGGIGVYGLDGRQIQYLATPGARPSSIDIRDGFTYEAGVVAPLVVTGDRETDKLNTYKLDPATRTLSFKGTVDTNGFAISSTCMYKNGTGSVYAFVTSVAPSVGAGTATEQWRLTYSRPLATVRGSLMPVRPGVDAGDNQASCVADDAAQKLYIAAPGGIFSFDAEAAADPNKAQIDTTGEGGHLHTDVGGLALARNADGSARLIAVTEGGERYAIYKRDATPGARPTFLRRARLVAGAGIDAPTSVGIDATGTALGSAFGTGLFAATDRSNEDAAPNVKLAPLGPMVDDLSSETPQFPDRPTTCELPYAADSPWNTPIAGGAPADPNTAAHIAKLLDTDGLSSDPDQFTYPVYYVDASTPVRSVRFTGTYSNVFDNTTMVRSVDGSVDIRIPDGAAPAAGDDSQIVLIDRTTGEEWGFWHIERDAQGHWTAENGYHYRTDLSGVPPADKDGVAFGSRGAGVSYLAGLVRPCEIDRGRIDHALAFAYETPRKDWIYPATKSDGASDDPDDLPEGARVQLDPTLTQADLAQLGCTGPCLTIASALQRYGMYLIDHAGRPKLMLEYRETAGWDASVDARTTTPIPLAKFRVLPLKSDG